MNSIFRNVILLLISLCVFQAAHPQSLKYEVYVTAEQVTQLLGDDVKREAALNKFNELGMSKLYLETIRSGIKPEESTLIAVRDYFLQHGYEVIGSVATTNGNGFGTPSNQPGIWLNYESRKTCEDMAAHFKWIAGLFDEIMIDDFFATDDISEESINAKRDRSWSEYRLELMTNFAIENVIQPARETNPNVKIILKFPQWYDRFHKFGYNVETAPQLFDRIWVGTETRNPETKRFGFTMPTMGFINYSWLKILAGKKIGGGWFDFGDCTPESFLMQAYQTVLAGADELILFQAESVLQPDPCFATFRKRQNAITALRNIIANQNIAGTLAYKPPQSEGSDENGAANLYLFDYAATIGLSPVMSPVSNALHQTVFLSRQAADDENIFDSIQKWLRENRTVIITPDFLMAANNSELVNLAGFQAPFILSSQREAVTQFKVDQNILESFHVSGQEKNGQNNPTVELRQIPQPIQASILASGLTNKGEIPLVVQKKFNQGKILTLNFDTFTHNEFAPDKEQFLPPRPVFIQYLPDEIIQRIQQEIAYPFGLQIQTVNHTGIYFYDRHNVVLSNFNPTTVDIDIRVLNNRQLLLDNHFPHLPESQCVLSEKKDDILSYRVRVPSWDLTVLTWDE